MITAMNRAPMTSRVLFAVMFVLLATVSVFADTVRVTVERALVWNHPSGTAVVVTQLRKDDVVEVVRRNGNWYEIVVPEPSFTDNVRTGFVVASQVVVDTVGPPSARARRRPAAAAAPRRPRRPGTSFLTIDGVRRRGEDDLTRTSTVFSSTLGENSTIATNYGNTTGWSLDFLGGGPVWRWVGVGFGVSYHRRDRAALVDALIPHPYFFDTFRPTSMTTEPLRARETAVHVPAVFLPPAFGPIRVVVFGGPSWFQVSQTVVTDITLNEVFPYNTVTIGAVKAEERKGTFPGYHAGADVSVFLSRYVGVGAGIRYSHANIDKFDGETTATLGISGGSSAVAGVRFRF